MDHRVRASAVLAFAAVSAGCASIVSGSNWPVTIQSDPPGRFVTVRDARGNVIHTGTTPTQVTLRSGDGYFERASYRVESSDGTSVEVTAYFNGWYVGNVIFGGLIGLHIVDPLTGAMWRMPETVGGAPPEPPPQ